MSGTLKNYYEILGVPRSASSDEIRTAYRKLLVKFHPDKNVGDAYFEDWSKKINEAFEVLMDPRIRSEYDKVYDETRMTYLANKKNAARGGMQSETAEKDTTVEATVENPPVVDDAMEQLIPQYINAKKNVVKLKRAFNEAEQQSLAIKKNRIPVQMAVALTVIVGISIWMAIRFFNPGAQGIPRQTVAQQSPQAATPLVSEPANAQTPPGIEDVHREFRVIAQRAYFYDKPGGEKSSTRFLSKGNKFIVTKRAGDFYYGNFPMISNPNYKMEGWMHIEDLQPLPQQ
ncbi:MAG: J domain-containing protein [Niabella sp.]